MPISRYRRTGLLAGGKKHKTSNVHWIIRRAALSGRITSTPWIVKEGERLDTIAGRVYGDGTLWWVIAAASGIGWCLQVPPGTLLLIPKRLGQINALVG